MSGLLQNVAVTRNCEVNYSMCRYIPNFLAKMAISMSISTSWFAEKYISHLLSEARNKYLKNHLHKNINIQESPVFPAFCKNNFLNHSSINLIKSPNAITLYLCLLLLPSFVKWSPISAQNSCINNCLNSLLFWHISITFCGLLWNSWMASLKFGSANCFTDLGFFVTFSRRL